MNIYQFLTPKFLKKNLKIQNKQLIKKTWQQNEEMIFTIQQINDKFIDHRIIKCTYMTFISI